MRGRPVRRDLCPFPTTLLPPSARQDQANRRLEVKKHVHDVHNYSSSRLLIYVLNKVTYLLTYLLTPWCRVLLEKLTGLQLVKKFPEFHGTRRFITALTSVRKLSLPWASPIQSIYPHPTSWRSILILSTHLRLGLPSGLLPSGFPSKILYTPLSSPIRNTCPAHTVTLLKFTLKQLRHVPVLQLHHHQGVH